MQGKQEDLSSVSGLFSADIAAETGSSNPRLTERYNVDVREFVVLACLDDIGDMDTRDIASNVGLSPTTTKYCLESLSENGLIEADANGAYQFRATDEGRLLIRKSRRAGY